MAMSMDTFNFNHEWEFVISEIHHKRPTKDNLIKREILFCLQVLLSRFEKKKYLALKKIYCSKKPKKIFLSF